ncbi:hypothetical protein NBRC110019_32400 [Neptunitalea chrysea]|uniref:Uncharacterized protein n=1 Tax=Neptunitalea chrysea TaxID=1647581 RepID=A0A9W6EVT4_9FLAO|nr:DUF6095 family protein [Neptunitalea chrysea]GLB54199.1 hypothetical protein NBRC110019_32400 [Neptunitalea chrysea]
MAANRELIQKGVVRLSLTIIPIFTGPIIIHSSFKNQDKPLFYPVLILGITVCVLGVFFAFKGLQLIVNGLFNDSDKK